MSSDTVASIRTQLTGPGGQFEVVTEVIDGHELKVYKDRFPNLRVVAQFAAAHGDKEFLVHGDRRITFADFLAASNSVSHELLAAGVGHGDRVAVLAQNSPEWCMAFWGTVDIGAVLVGLNGWWNTDEIIYGLEDSGAKVLVVDAKRFARIADAVDAHRHPGAGLPDRCRPGAVRRAAAHRTALLLGAGRAPDRRSSPRSPSTRPTTP